MSRPSALAVLRLMTSSYLLGACTGKSAGFSPFRMRSIDIAGRSSELVDEIRSMRDQAASGGEEAFVVDRGQLVPRREGDDQIAMNLRTCARSDDQAAI